MKTLLLLLVLSFVFPVTIVSAQSSWTIPQFHSAITLQTDGKVAVVERIQVDFKNEEKHGIYRDIPYVYQTDTGKKIYSEISVQTVRQNDEQAEYKVTKNESNIRIRIGDPDRTISGRHAYEISYTAVGVLRSFTDHDELYWNVTGNEWEATILKATATVTIPQDHIKKVACYEGYTGSTATCTATQNSSRVAGFSTSETLLPGKGMTLVTGFTQGMVPIPTVAPPKRIEEEIFKPMSIAALSIALMLGIGFIVNQWYKSGRDLWFKTPSTLDPNAAATNKPLFAHETIVVEFEPPEKLPPAVIGVLMDEKADTLDVTATLIDLATRGYLTIKEEPKTWLFGKVDYMMTKQPAKKRTDTLLPYEKLLLDRLFMGAETMTMSALKQTFYSDLAEVKAALYTHVTEGKLFIRNPETTRNLYLGLALGIGMLGGIGVYAGINFISGPLAMFGAGIIISSIFALLFSRAMPQRTALGNELYRRTKGYRMFIGGAEKYRQKFFEKENIFHEVLPYAIVFGLTDKYAKAMAEMGIQTQQPGWYYGSRPFNPGYFVSDINSFSSSLSSAIASAPSSSGFSGGSSGGGSGGGGGGSW